MSIDSTDCFTCNFSISVLNFSALFRVIDHYYKFHSSVDSAYKFHFHLMLYFVTPVVTFINDKGLLSFDKYKYNLAKLEIKRKYSQIIS